MHAIIVCVETEDIRLSLASNCCVSRDSRLLACARACCHMSLHTLAANESRLTHTVAHTHTVHIALHVIDTERSSACNHHLSRHSCAMKSRACNNQDSHMQYRCLSHAISMSLACNIDVSRMEYQRFSRLSPTDASCLRQSCLWRAIIMQ